MEYEGMGRDKNRTVGFGEVVLGRVGYGRLGCFFFYFSISCTFKRQIKYPSK